MNSGSKSLGMAPIGTVAKVTGRTVLEGSSTTSHVLILGQGNNSHYFFPMPDGPVDKPGLAEAYLSKFQDKYVVVCFNPASGVLFLRPVKIAEL